MSTKDTQVPYFEFIISIMLLGNRYITLASPIHTQRKAVLHLYLSCEAKLQPLEIDKQNQGSFQWTIFSYQ